MRPSEHIPRNNKNTLSAIAAALFAAAVAVMWFLKDEIGISSGDMCILTGAALVMIIFTIADFMKKKQIYLDAMELKRQRDEMKTDDFNDNSIFFE